MFGVLCLTGLDVALNAKGGAVAAAFATPAEWLAKWMDPNTPLITRPAPAAAASGSSSGSPGGSNPAGANTNKLGESTTGACPPGFPAGVKCLGM